ncbi:hypothetical protein ACLB2K_035132 [Fragaria x ananassa]
MSLKRPLESLTKAWRCSTGAPIRERNGRGTMSKWKEMRSTLIRMANNEGWEMMMLGDKLFCWEEEEQWGSRFGGDDVSRPTSNFIMKPEVNLAGTTSNNEGWEMMMLGDKLFCWEEEEQWGSRFGGDDVSRPTSNFIMKPEVNLAGTTSKENLPKIRHNLP